MTRNAALIAGALLAGCGGSGTQSIVAPARMADQFGAVSQTQALRSTACLETRCIYVANPNFGIDQFKSRITMYPR